jgi:putative ABC transport system permease protein
MVKGVKSGRAATKRVRLRPSDAIVQAVSYPLNRPWRSLLTILGTVLGVGMLVATLGITTSARARVNQRFDALLATEVDAQGTGTEQAVAEFSRPAVERVRRLQGVAAAGVIRQVPSGIAVTADSFAGAAAAATNSGGSPSLYTASVGALAVIGPTMKAGRMYDNLEEGHAARVAIAGEAAAREMGIATHSLPRTIYIDGTAFLVIGIIERVKRHNEYLLSVVIPEATEQALLGTSVSAPPELVIATKLGYANAVGAVLPPTISPASPASVAVSTPPTVAELQQQVSTDIGDLFVVLAGIGLLVGMIGIANTTLVSVLERVPEIGLRRAIGARRRQIGLQFLIESLMLGSIGGVLGGALGMCSVSVVAVTKGWSPVIPLWICLAAPALGSLTGVLAGAYPASRAARVEPVAALAR